MCGVPVHAAEGYLEKLIRKGFQVAVCEQMEDPGRSEEARRSKAVVRREVIRLVTPGTLTEDSLLDARRHNYLAALADAGGEFGLAWLDMSTGDFHAQPMRQATSAPRWRGSIPARSCWPTGCCGMPSCSSVQRLEVGALAAAHPRFDCENGAAPAGEALRRAGAGWLRRLLPRRARGRRRAGRLSGDDAEGQAAAPLAAEAPGAGGCAGDRRGDAAQSRTDAQPRRRAPGLAAVGHRPHRQRRRARGCWRPGSRRR